MRDPCPELPALAARHLDELTLLADHGVSALAGDTLLHNDVRADNLIVDAGGGVTLVDWPHASRGCDWFDSLCLLVNVELYGSHDVEQVLGSAPQLSAVPPEAASGVLAGLCGYFYDASRQPAPRGLPTVRRFQRDQGEAVLNWLARRLEWI